LIASRLRPARQRETSSSAMVAVALVGAAVVTASPDGWSLHSSKTFGGRQHLVVAAFCASGQATGKVNGVLSHSLVATDGADLKPITNARQIRLTDAAAARPDDVPHGEHLDKAIDHEQKRLKKLQSVLYADARYALLVVLQGRDASGKDGTIKRVFRSVNP